MLQGDVNGNFAVCEKDKMPLTYSIVIPTKNRPAFLLRAVRSAVLAARPSCEIVVVDDNSTVPATEVLKNLSHQDLRIITVQDGQTGVSAARNTGLAAARNDVIFFLDDDDELIEDYCSRVIAQAATDHDYGFSSFLTKGIRDANPKQGRKRFADGTISPSAPLHRQLCGFGMGFWIRREIALETGDVDAELTINEDTDYVCRLIKAEKRAWYSATPGVVLHSHSGGGQDIGHLTKRSSAGERARCMRALCDRYPDFAHHLGPSYVRHCLRTDAGPAAWDYIKSQTNLRLRAQLSVFAAVKSIVYRLNGRRNPT